MKILIHFFFVLNLLLAIGCAYNPPTNNIVEQSQTADTTIFTKNKPLASVIQNDTSKTNKLVLIKKTSHTLESDDNAPIKEILMATQTYPKGISENIFSKKSQFFTFQPKVETIIHGAEGTTLTIPADCFETETGNILRGEGQLELKEFLKTSDMILANLSTESDGKMLETGGMIYLNAKDTQGHSLKIRTDKNIKIKLPPSVKTADKELFYGNQEANGQINWHVAKPTVTVQNDNVFKIIEQSPEFPNGQAALFRFIQNQMVYPKIARENKIEGTVYVGFTVLPDGSLANIQVKRGIRAGCNEEAVRIIKKMPRWRPGRSQGSRVSVAYTLPIKFRLDAPSAQNADSLKIESFDEKQDTGLVNKYIEIDDEQNAVMRSNKLGWINCDRFVNLQNTTDFDVLTNKTDADVRLVFKNYRSIISAWTNLEKKAHFSNVPLGEPIFIVATSPEGNEFNISVTKTVISKDHNITIELEKVEKEVFLRELHRLDSFK